MRHAAAADRLISAAAAPETCRRQPLARKWLRPPKALLRPSRFYLFCSIGATIPSEPQRRTRRRRRRFCATLCVGRAASLIAIERLSSLSIRRRQLEFRVGCYLKQNLGGPSLRDDATQRQLLYIISHLDKRRATAAAAVLSAADFAALFATGGTEMRRRLIELKTANTRNDQTRKHSPREQVGDRNRLAKSRFVAAADKSHLWPAPKAACAAATVL